MSKLNADPGQAWTKSTVGQARTGNACAKNAGSRLVATQQQYGRSTFAAGDQAGDADGISCRQDGDADGEAACRSGRGGRHGGPLLGERGLALQHAVDRGAVVVGLGAHRVAHLVRVRARVRVRVRVRVRARVRVRVRVSWPLARTGRCRSAGWAACTWLRLELGLGLGLGSGLGLGVDPLDGQLVPG